LVLNSWKEIAQYLDRGVRTVQRWERELKLPVHRIGNTKRSPVFAVVAELNFWLATSGASEAPKVSPAAYGRGGARGNIKFAARLYELAQAVARASVRQQEQTESLRQNIAAIRSRVS
jgi:hypothetical protein